MLIKLDEIQLEQPLVKNSKLFDYRLISEQKALLQKQLGSIGYSFDTYTSFAITDKESDGKPANYALIPNQYFIFASEMYEFASELFKYFEIYEKLRPYANNLLGNSEQIKNNIGANQELSKYFDSENDLDLFSKFLDKDDATFRLGSKRLINDQGKPRGSRDCFGSVILKEINLPDASSSVFGRLVYDLCKSPNTYKSVYDVYSLTKKIPVNVRNDILEDCNKITLSKPFLLLAGISGTGKTRFIRKQAELTGSIEGTYCLTSVRPDWHEPSDLLGYISRLSGNTEYIVTNVLKFIVKAWIAIKEAGITLQDKEATGEQEQQEQVEPYWLCLDEMNLAPVEQYFADYLSVLETREWAWQGNNFTYRCDPLLKATVFDTVDQNKLRNELGLDGHDKLWDHFVTNGISIPFNLIVAGTVNMDETTHGFSRKVIDRALTFDFGEFFPNDFKTFFEPKSKPKALTYPTLSDGRTLAELQTTFDKDGSLSIEFLKAVNTILNKTSFELAFRALNELLVSVVTQKPTDEIQLQAVWDDFLMCKVLPRIEGDIDKLTKGETNQNILEQLGAKLSQLLDKIWEAQIRPDLFQTSINENSPLTLKCRSKAKLEWMNDQLKNGFTSFWP